MKNSSSCAHARSPQNLKFGHFTLLFCRGRQRNVQKHKTHVQSYCFCRLNLLFCGVLVAVAVVVAYRIYSNKRRGAYLVFRVSGAALIRGRCLFKRLIPQGRERGRLVLSSRQSLQPSRKN